MSITDELRKWFKDRFFMANGWQEIHDIADRIDAEHEAMLVDARKTVYQGYIELPKDADGEPIHVGDKVVDWDTPRLVVAVSEDSICLAGYESGSYYRMGIAKNYRHYHKPTVEEVLREMADRIYADEDEPRDRDAIVAEYAKRLTLAEGEDA